MALPGTLIGFVISLLVSGAIIFFATKLLGEKEGYGTAVLTAFIGALIYAVAYNFLSGFWASVLGGLAWLIAIGTLYGVGWVASFLIAILIWAFAALVSYVLPTVGGPL